MSTQFFLTISQIAELCQAKIINLTEDQPIYFVKSPEKAQKGDICYINHYKDRAWLQKTSASACITSPHFSDYATPSLPLVIVEQAYNAYCQVGNFFAKAQNYADNAEIKADLRKIYRRHLNKPAKQHTPNNSYVATNVKVAKNAYIGNNCQIGENCTIMPGVYIGDNVVIGQGSTIYPNCYIAHAQIGEFCIIQPGTVIGSEPFAYSYNATISKNVRLASFAGVKIGNNVEIGANCCIDRGTIADTTIDSNCKLDNQIHVGHDAIIGSSCLIAAQTALGGHSELGAHCVVSGQVGLIQKVSVGSGTFIAAKSTVIQDIPAHSKVAGTPAMEIMDWRRSIVALRRLGIKNS